MLLRRALDGLVIEQQRRVLRFDHIQLEKALRTKGAVRGDGDTMFSTQI